MSAKRIILGLVLGVALTVGFWATAPGAEPVRAQNLNLPFQCSSVVTLPFVGLQVATLNNIPFAVAAAALAQGASCIPQAAADASPRFNCTLQGRTFNNRTITGATAILKAGGQCTPAIALPALPTLPS